MHTTAMYVLTIHVKTCTYIVCDGCVFLCGIQAVAVLTLYVYLTHRLLYAMMAVAVYLRYLLLYAV